MFCEKCGNPIKDDEKSCGKCGNAVMANVDGTSGAEKPPVKSSAAKIAVALYWVGAALFILAAIDYAGVSFDYDITGVSWSPCAFGALGALCVSVANKLNPPKTDDND